MIESFYTTDMEIREGLATNELVCVNKKQLEKVLFICKLAREVAMFSWGAQAREEYHNKRIAVMKTLRDALGMEDLGD
jgi:hypothetical protein